MHRKRIHINQNWDVNKHTKFKMATSYCCNTTRHCKGIHSLFLSKMLFYMMPTPIIVVSFTHNQHYFVEKGRHIYSEPREIQDGCQGSCMTMFIFTIVSFIQWELYHLRPTMILPDSWYRSMTHNPPHHPFAVFEKCSHYGKYYPLGMSQTWCMSGCRSYSQTYGMYIAVHCCP